MNGPRLVLGVDVGGTKLRAALATDEGSIVAELVEPTIAADGSRMIGQIARAADELARRSNVARGSIAVAGVSLPVTIEPPSGRLGSVGNVPGLAGIDARAVLSRALSMPVTVDNDANLAALGERWRGAAVGVDDFVAIAIGTGIGMGIVSGGRLVHGAHGAAGEIGFLPLGGDPLDRRSRVEGAYEGVAAGPALRARIDAATEATASGAGATTVLRPGATLSDVAAAARRGDHVARQILEEEAGLVALGIAAVVAILDPELVLLTGGVGSVAGLIGPVRRHARILVQRPPEIRRGALGERAPLDGAIWLALRSPDEDRQG